MKTDKSWILMIAVTETVVIRLGVGFWQLNMPTSVASCETIAQL